MNESELCAEAGEAMGGNPRSSITPASTSRLGAQSWAEAGLPRATHLP